jgi:hypothetical protein
MPKNYNTDYLKFDSSSIKETIFRKLSENANFTDHLFEDSNLNILIDTFAYLFEVLMYYINHGASESLLSDARLYENMNRLVKMLGYNPFGFQACKTSVIFTNKDQEAYLFDDATKILPKYSYIETSVVDKFGNPVIYSTINNFTVEKHMKLDNIDKVTMVNGKWRLYNRTFTASGLVLEEFLLSDLKLMDPEMPTAHIAHPYIDVYVKRDNKFIYFAPIAEGNLFGSGTSIVGPGENVFELRINENYNYSIKFGDGIHGSKLKENDEIYVVYLKSNGPEGKIGPGVINENSPINYGISGLDPEIFFEFLGIDESHVLDPAQLSKLNADNINASSSHREIESVDQIRQNAPNWFRTGGRLITAQDFEQYIKSTYINDIYDVTVMNNWEYMISFQKWLSDYEALSIDIRNEQYVFADSCDFNNVYLWIKFKTDIDYNFIERSLIPKKVLTAEPIITKPLDFYLVPGLIYNEYELNNWDPDFENWIEILKDKNSIISAEKIKSLVVSEIEKFFDPEKMELGHKIDLGKLSMNLLNVDGIKSIKTAFKDKDDPINTTSYINGLSFLGWTPAIINGEDLEQISGAIDLEKFQFPVLLKKDLSKRIKVVFETLGQPSIEY